MWLWCSNRRTDIFTFDGLPSEYRMMKCKISDLSFFLLRVVLINKNRVIIFFACIACPLRILKGPPFLSFLWEVLKRKSGSNYGKQYVIPQHRNKIVEESCYLVRPIPQRVNHVPQQVCGTIRKSKPYCHHSPKWDFHGKPPAASLRNGCLLWTWRLLVNRYWCGVNNMPADLHDLHTVTPLPVRQSKTLALLIFR